MEDEQEMENEQYLKLCQQCAMQKNPKAIPERLLVLYDGIKYYPCGYEIIFDSQGRSKHLAKLHDINTNTVMYCEIKRVQAYGKN